MRLRSHKEISALSFGELMNSSASPFATARAGFGRNYLRSEWVCSAILRTRVHFVAASKNFNLGHTPNEACLHIVILAHATVEVARFV